MKKQYIYVLVLILIVAGFFAFSRSQNNQVENTNTTASEQALQEKQAILTAGTVTTTLKFTEGKTLYDALVQAKAEGLSIEFKEYPGMGYFVTQVGSLVPGKDKYLMYLVNGEEASVGISTYVLKDGDVITWEIR
jgi:hypothetical protein